MNAQFRKGVHELCVGALLLKRDYYGYEMVSEIDRDVGMSEGSIYPLLKRLREMDMISTYWQESSDGPPRKYYRLTECGRSKYQALIREWKTFELAVDRIVAREGDGHDAESV